MRGILPALRVETGYLRTTDPIGAFGTTLRQRVITQQDFDPGRLNYPAATPNYLGSVVVEQPLFNADAWAGRRAATHAADAADAARRWTEQSTHVDVIKAWLGAILAQEKVATLTAGLRAAREHVRQAESMARNGLVTSSDAMLASVKAGEVEAQLLEARGDVAIARAGLSIAMGSPGDSNYTLPSQLPAAEVVRPMAQSALALERGARADVRAATAARDAADADTRRARMLYLPRVNSFARYDWNSSQLPFGGDNNWTIGIMASWSPFAGAAEIAEARATSGRAAAAQAMQDGALARAQLDDVQTARQLEVALARLDIAERGIRQAADAHRIVARKYEGGLATVVELLDASAVDTQARLTEAAARWQLATIAAERYRALGRNPAALVALDTPAVATISDDRNR
jgi:outer membrane protein TolC